MYYQVVVQAMIIALWSCFSFWPTAAVAHPVGKKDRVLLTFSAGPAWYHAGETQTFNVQPDVVNTYDARNNTHALASGELSFSIQHLLSSSLLGQVGLAVAKSSNATLQGDVWQTADPVFNNFAYQYHESHAHVAIKAKLLTLIFSQIWTPYLSASVGAGRNHVYGYHATPNLTEELPMPDFKANTQTAFTYTAGVGIQTTLGAHWAAGCGYEFADWGTSALARATGQTLNTGIALTHLYTHQLQFNLSYFFV